MLATKAPQLMLAVDIARRRPRPRPSSRPRPQRPMLWRQQPPTHPIACRRFRWPQREAVGAADSVEEALEGRS